MTTIGHVFIPLNREHDGKVPTGDDQAHFESLSIPLALWQPFEQCLSEHLSELTEGQIDRDESFCFEAPHVNAMIAVVEAEAVTATPDLRNWLLSLAATPLGRSRSIDLCLLWIAKLDAACLGGGQRMACALADHVALVLGSGGEQVKGQPVGAPQSNFWAFRFPKAAMEGDVRSGQVQSRTPDQGLALSPTPLNH